MKFLFIAFVPFLLTSACIVAALSVLSDVQAEEQRQQTAREIASDCRGAQDAVLQAAAMLSLFSRTHNPELLDEFKHSQERANAKLAHLQDVVKEQSVEARSDVQQLRAVSAQIEQMTQEVLAHERSLRGPRKWDLLGLMQLKEKALAKFLLYRKLVERLEDIANKVSNEHAPRSPLHYFLRNNMALAIGSTLFVSIALAWLLARAIVYRLQQLTDKAARLAMLQAPEAPKQGNDEIARLDQVLTDMALKLLDAVRREQAAIASAADIILSVDGAGLVRSANQALVQRCGWKVNEVEGKAISDLVPEPDRQRLDIAFATREPKTFEAALLPRQGEPSFCLWSTSWSAGQQAHIAVIHDITQRKRAEQLLAENESKTRLFMQHMPAGLLLLSADGTVIFANDTALHLCGRDQNDLIGLSIGSLLDSGSKEKDTDIVQLLVQRGRAYVAGIKCGDGTERHVKLVISAFGKQSGEDVYLAIMIDDTERSHFEELKQRLIAMLAHDMSTPLVTVESTIGLIATGMFGDIGGVLSSQINQAAAESSQVLQVFRNMVRFQKLASGFSSLIAGRISLAELTREALDVVIEAASEKQLTIKNNVPGDINCLGEAEKLAVLAATVLQAVVEICQPQTSLQFECEPCGGTVAWQVRALLDTKAKGMDRLRSYTDASAFDLSDGRLSEDIDLILWQLLLYQCDAKVAFSMNNNEMTLDLLLPCSVGVLSGRAG